MLKFVSCSFLSILMLLVFESASADDQRFSKISTYVDRVEIHFTKKISEEKIFLVPSHNTTLKIYPIEATKYYAAFDLEAEVANNCYKIKVKSKYWAPYNRSSKETWCFENKTQQSYQKEEVKLAEKEAYMRFLINDVKAKIAHLDQTYSDECKSPQPIVRPNPEEYCSNEALLLKKRNQCYSPLIKAACTYSINELSDMSLSEAERLSIPLACVGVANSLVDKDTDVGDLVVAGTQSLLMSGSGIKGFFGNFISFTLAAARHDSCVSNIRYDCNPPMPAAPDCSDYKSEKRSLVQTLRESSELEGEINLLKESVGAFKTAVRHENF